MNENVNEVTKQSNYEAPELLELGMADQLTLGVPNQNYADGCDCRRSSPLFS